MLLKLFLQELSDNVNKRQESILISKVFLELNKILQADMIDLKVSICWDSCILCWAERSKTSTQTKSWSIIFEGLIFYTEVDTGFTKQVAWSWAIRMGKLLVEGWQNSSIRVIRWKGSVIVCIFYKCAKADI